MNASGHYSSAKDLATLAQYARTLPLFRQIVDTEGVCLPTLPGQKPRRWDHNSNALLKKLDWVNGVKTGSTPDSAFCLVASGTQEGVNVIAVVLGAKTADARWTEAQELMEYGFALHPTTVLASKGEVLATVPLPDIMGRSMKLVADGPVTARLGKADVVTRSVVLDRDLALPVTAGEIYGRAIYSLNGAIIGSVELRAEQPVTRPTLDAILFYWRAQSQVKIVRPA